MLKCVAIFAIISAVALAEQYGFDVAYAYPQDSWECLKQQRNMTFAVVRCYQSLGHVDPNCAESVRKAWAIGLKRVDLYMFPCPKCGNPAKQVTDLEQHITDNGIKFNMLWMDIEGPEYWMSTSENRAFYSELDATARKLFKGKWGTYTNKNGWESIMGAWTPNETPLWHAYWDNKPTLDGFTPFDGFNSRVMKQYHGGIDICNMDVDLDYF